jgi:transcriptional regulator with XRE-family HTH domain
MNDSEKILAFINALGLKQKEFAENVGLSSGGISSILSGRSGISKILKTAITLRYNVNPEWWTNDNAEMFLKGKPPEITLTDEERTLIISLRELPKKEREKAWSVIKSLLGE